MDNPRTALDRTRRIVLVTNIPTPYRIPLFNELAAELQRKGFDFEVVFAALGYARRKWKIDLKDCSFKYHVLNCRKLPSANPEKAVFTYGGLGRYVSRRAALVIVGGFSLASVKVWINSFLRGTPYLIWSGAVLSRGRRDRAIQRFQRRLLVKRAKGFVTYGSRARDYLVGLGANPSAVSIAINTVDCSFFRERAAHYRTLNADKRGPREILHIGNLETGKRIDNLFKAIQRIAPQRDDFRVTLLGTGSQEAALKQMAQDLGIADRVDFRGFVQKEQVAESLANASCLVFPSEYDVWGLVLIEAMAAGVPCLSSIYAGATSDVVRDGVNGFALDFNDTQAVADRLNWVLDRPAEAAELGRQAQQFVETHVSLRVSASGFSEAIERVLGGQIPLRDAEVEAPMAVQLTERSNVGLTTKIR